MSQIIYTVHKQKSFNSSLGENNIDARQATNGISVASPISNWLCSRRQLNWLEKQANMILERNFPTSGALCVAMVLSRWPPSLGPDCPRREAIQAVERTSDKKADWALGFGHDSDTAWLLHGFVQVV